MIELLFAITAMSLVGGTVAAAIAWRALRENHRRSEARVARLTDAILAAEPREGTPVSTAHLLDTVGTSSEPHSRHAIALLAVLATVSLAFFAYWMSRSIAPDARSPGASVAHAESSRAGTSPTLELVSLVHERAADGALELRGQVHNPENGATLEDVTAVAMLFDRQGAYLASGRAPLAARQLAHGADATFAISVPDAAAAERYRVSFRTHDRIIPHTDRRRDH
jgi:hypothetical protein